MILIDLILVALSVLTWIIIGQAILSWLVAFRVIDPTQDWARNLLGVLDRMTDPLYRPVRAILPDFGGIDFSPVVVLVAIQIIRQLLFSLGTGGL